MAYYVMSGMRSEDQEAECEYSVYFKWMDGDFDRVDVCDRTPDGGAPITRTHSGRRMAPDNMPTKIKRINPNRKSVPLLDVERWTGCFLVNHTFKDILEEMEPDVHQLFPMEIFEKDEKIADYYWLNVCNRLDTYHPELTYPRNARGFYKPKKGEPASVVFSTDAIGDHHCWIDKFAGSSTGVFMSDQLVERLRAAGLTGLKYNAKKQV